MPIVIQLDRAREIRWTMRAQARNASLPRPASFREIGSSKRRLYALCAILWSALVDKDHEFSEPEDLAAHLETADQQVAALEAVNDMLTEAFPPAQKKTGDGAKK